MGQKLALFMFLVADSSPSIELEVRLTDAEFGLEDCTMTFSSHGYEAEQTKGSVMNLPLFGLDGC